MEQKQICNGPVYDRLPPLSANHPWLVARNLEAEDDGEHIFYTLHDPMSHYRCRIPELRGRRIRGCFHGWVILSNHPHGDKWSLWNPATSKCIFLPRLVMKDGDSNEIRHCCLSSPPDDPGSIILLTRKTKPNFVFCRLDRKRKRLRWTEMSYSKQLRSISGVEKSSLLLLTCCNGNVYSLIDKSNEIVHVQIVVEDKEVVISLSPFAKVPNFYGAGSRWDIYLNGSSQELFAIMLGFIDFTEEKPVDVSLYKLDVTTMVWTEMKELKGMVLFVDMNWDMSVTCRHAIASEFGGYVHIFHKTSNVICSYDVKDKSISMSYMQSLDLPARLRSGALRTSHISVWTMPGFRLQGDHGEANCRDHSKQDEMVVRSVTNDEVEFSNETNESQLLNIPFHVLEMIMEFCVGVEYLNFRATCKRCHLAAPVIQWSNQERLQTYSLSSPWMMTFEKDEGVITFTDPMFGDKYFIKASEELFYYKRILCSRYGWLLLFTGLQRLVFFNPFTSDKLELPPVPHLECFCFSAPPTSPDCTVVGFFTNRFDHEVTTIYLHSVGREPSWRTIHLDLDSVFFMFPTFCGRDVYVVTNEGELHVLEDDDLSFEDVVAEAPRDCSRASTREYFLVKCDEYGLLLVVVGDFGESVEVFKLKLKDDCGRKEWEKMEGLGRHVIYICGTMCLCVDAKTPEMENKIFFPLLHSENEKMVFYSLQTRSFHTFNENLRDVFETKHKFSAHVWIEPSWLGLPA